MAKNKMPRAEEVAAALRELGFDRQKAADRFGITLKDAYRLTRQARLQGLLGEHEGKAKPPYDKKEFAAAYNELGGDCKKLAERFGITIKAVYDRVAKLRQKGMIDVPKDCVRLAAPITHGKTEYKTVDRSITMVFTSAAGDIFCATQKIGQEGWIKFSFILNGKGNWYANATLFLSEEEVRRVERGITFALACKMLSDARRQMARGKFDAASYMSARIATLGGSE